MINKEITSYGIHGAEHISMCKYNDDRFPLVVSLIAAPAHPMPISVANYMTCIEGKMVFPAMIHESMTSEEIIEKFEWILKGGHTPSLECIHLTFGIENASVVLLKQISRHRIGNSLGVMTQRANADEWLGNLFNNSHYVIPPSFKDNPEVGALYADLMVSAQKFYNFCIKEGIQQDEARYGIPQGVMSMWQGTYAYKTLLDSICSTRLCHIMQGEMVVLARLMAEAVKEYNPIMGNALKPICLRYGKCNRNENNPTNEHPNGVCELTKLGTVPVRDADKIYDLTQYSKDVDK